MCDSFFETDVMYLRSKITYFVHLAGSCKKLEFCHLYCNSEVVKAMGLPEMRVVALFSFGLPRIINFIITAEFQRLLSQENLTIEDNI